MIVTKQTPEPAEGFQLQVRIFRVEAVSKISSRFGDPFETPLDRIYGPAVVLKHGRKSRFHAGVSKTAVPSVPLYRFLDKRIESKP